MTVCRELSTFETAFGWCAMVGSRDVLIALAFGHRTAAKAVDWLDPDLTLCARKSSWNHSLTSRIAAMFEGEPDDFRDVVIDESHLTPFGRRVISACRRISWGHTTSYGKLARQAGSAGAARAVGQVMAFNRTPLIVPCHRVVASRGQLGGFSAPRGSTMKRRLLSLESGVYC